METNRAFFYPWAGTKLIHMLISVHLPKTAGTSFRSSLESHFSERLLLDYEDRPINQTTISRNCNVLKASVLNRYRRSEYACIHGHFMPLKYRWINNRELNKYVVWLRDPIERLASHYYYWLRDYNPSQAGRFRRRVVEESWSLEQFCFSGEMRNIYSKCFWGFPVTRFDFVGIVENYALDLNYFSTHVLQAELQLREQNTNPRKTEDRYITDDHLRSRLEHFHDDDMRLYRAALVASNKRSLEI